LGHFVYIQGAALRNQHTKLTTMAPSQLQIKVNALKRLMKEQALYKKEAEADAKRVEQAKEEGKDEYEIKKMNEVLQETQKMVPELNKKIQTTLNGLKELLSSDLDEDTTSAKEVAEEAEKFLQN
jgi:tubulin-specific chaperone A